MQALAIAPSAAVFAAIKQEGRSGKKDDRARRATGQEGRSRGCADHARQLCRSPPPGTIAPDMTSALPFDDFRHLLANLPAADMTAQARVRTLLAKADKPGNSLGRIE